jgi:hypothetical protein
MLILDRRMNNEKEKRKNLRRNCFFLVQQWRPGSSHVKKEEFK